MTKEQQQIQNELMVIFLNAQYHLHHRDLEDYKKEIDKLKAFTITRKEIYDNRGK